MSDTHRANPRVYVHVVESDTEPIERRWLLVYTATDQVVYEHRTRTAALAAASRLNGYDMTPEQDRKEHR
jgi:hypothetical protein